MAPTESQVARLGLLALTLVLWRHAAALVWQGLLPRYPVAVAIVIVLFLVSAGIVLFAVTQGDVKRASRLTIAAFVLVIFAYAYRDHHYKLDNDTMPTSDGHVFMDIAARKLLQGKNPYAESMMEA